LSDHSNHSSVHGSFRDHEGEILRDEVRNTNIYIYIYILIEELRIMFAQYMQQ